MLPIKVHEHLELRLMQEDDGHEFFETIESNRQHLLPWFNFLDSTNSVHDARTFITRAQKNYEDTGRFWAAVFYCEKLAGCVGLTKLEPDNHSAEIGYWLSCDFVGKGIITKVGRELVHRLFIQYGLNRIVIQCATDNSRSMAVAHRLGFYNEGTLRQAEFYNGRFRDIAIYSLLADEWRERQPSTEGELSSY